jgi:uncharacterized protein with GYD domain
MPKYLIQASYTAEGSKGLLKEGGSKRREAVKRVIEDVGAKLEAFYFALGEADAYAIVDAPDNISITTHALVVNASGAVHVKTVVLLIPEEVDQAAKKKTSYRPPGQ